MKRIEFLKKAGVGILTFATLVSCTKEEDVIINKTTSSTGSTNGSSADNCTVTNSEAAGPFPTKDPASLVGQDIRSDRSGILLQVWITIRNKKTDCTTLQGAWGYIWHCDADGYYSEYGSPQMN